MMDGGMGSMMGWMMGFGLLGWVLIIALLVTIVVALIRLLNKPPGGSSSDASRQDRQDKPTQ